MGKKSRRAFLADVLFLGGGLTAAAFLSTSGREPNDYAESPTGDTETSECPPAYPGDATFIKQLLEDLDKNPTIQGGVKF
mgnify:CR=1 FL=1